MLGPNWAHGQSSDLVKLKRELEFPSLNSPQSHYTILQTVSSSLIHLIQQLDVNLISEAIIQYKQCYGNVAAPSPMSLTTM